MQEFWCPTECHLDEFWDCSTLERTTAGQSVLSGLREILIEKLGVLCCVARVRREQESKENNRKGRKKEALITMGIGNCAVAKQKGRTLVARQAIVGGAGPRLQRLQGLTYKHLVLQHCMPGLARVAAFSIYSPLVGKLQRSSVSCHHLLVSWISSYRHYRQQVGWQSKHVCHLKLRLT